MLSNQLADSLRPLCYEHHTEMSLVQMVSGNGGPPQELEYTCQASDCFVRYTGVRGYFIAPRNGSGVAEEILPRVRCRHDQAPTYLAQVRPEEKSFRLWKCPLCNGAFTSGDVLAAAG